jgi:glycosyltransferase involved in cell wall biosynthesis
MKVSIITVCYNAEAVIENAIKSVISQTYGDIEYIIVDGNSTDGTMDIVSRYKDKIAVAVSEQDNGIYDAMNKGIKIATGDIVYFLNSDDWFYDSDVIFDAARKFENNLSLSFIFGKVEKINKLEGARDELIFTRGIRKKSDLLRSSICHQSVFVKKEVFDGVGFFDTHYKIYADYDWLLRVLNKKIEMCFFDRFIAYYNDQGRSYKYFRQAKFENCSIVYKNFGLAVFIYFILRYYFYVSLPFHARKFIRMAKTRYIFGKAVK